MSAYLDASVIVPLFAPDSFTPRSDALVRKLLPDVIVSDFAAAEFASAVARRVRMGERTTADALAAFAEFDSWAAGTRRTEIFAADVAMAATILRALDLPLRTMDAIHIAAARRLEATLVTFDRRMAESAAALGIEVLAE